MSVTVKTKYPADLAPPELGLLTSPILLATGYAELPTNLSIHLPRLAKPYQQDDVAAEISKLLAPGAAGAMH